MKIIQVTNEGVEMGEDSEAKYRNLRSKVVALSRIIMKAQHYAERDPEVALTQARKSAEAICRSVFAAEIGEPGKIMLDELIKRLNEKGLVPRKILMPLNTIQGYGNYGTHAQSDLDDLDAEYIAPCLSALATVTSWYFLDYLRMEIPAEINQGRAIDKGAKVSLPPPTPQPHVPTPEVTLLCCPHCGRKNRPEDTFDCTACMKTNLCVLHMNEALMICARCAEVSRNSPNDTAKLGENHRKHTAADAAKRPPVNPHPGKSWTDPVTGLDFCWIPPGDFLMGSPEDEPRRSQDEGPQHRVSISRGFWMGRSTVTQICWLSVMKEKRSRFPDNPRNPVECVSWEDAQAFLAQLNKFEDRPSDLWYRLPSEAEWEYACRAGTTTPFNTGNSLTTKQANWNGNSPYELTEKGDYLKTTTPVGSYPPNAWGLVDMHGNIFEWCQDRYHRSYEGAPVDGSAWELGVHVKWVQRGGCWYFGANECRSAYRGLEEPDQRGAFTGFRIVLAEVPKKP